MCRSDEVIHKNGTEQAENGTTALARVWQNGTVPCRLCRADACAVCAVSLPMVRASSVATAWEKAFASGCLRYAEKHGKLTEKQHASALEVAAKVVARRAEQQRADQRAQWAADPRFAAWEAGAAEGS